MLINSRDCERACPPVCDWVFGRIWVLPSIQFGTRVEWLMHPNFTDPEPYSFQLQAGRTGNPLADDWEDVGFPAENVAYLTDDTQRVYGKTQWTCYRVVLTTPKGIYISKPQPALGETTHHGWRLMRDIIRREIVNFKNSRAPQGKLLKRRLFGVPCPEPYAHDHSTVEITDPHCPVCYGTGFLGGYFAPVPCFYAGISPHIRNEKLDNEGRRGTINDIGTKARLLAVPLVNNNDVWVNANNDQRWIIHQVDHIVEIDAIPVVVSAEFRLAPYTHPIYSIPV